MKKRIALFAILIGCLFAVANLQPTSVSADFADADHQEVEID